MRGARPVCGVRSTSGFGSGLTARPEPGPLWRAVARAGVRRAVARHGVRAPGRGVRGAARRRDGGSALRNRGACRVSISGGRGGAGASRAGGVVGRCPGSASGATPGFGRAEAGGDFRVYMSRPRAGCRGAKGRAPGPSGARSDAVPRYGPAGRRVRGTRRVPDAVSEPGRIRRRVRGRGEWLEAMSGAGPDRAPRRRDARPRSAGGWRPSACRRRRVDA